MTARAPLDQNSENRGPLGGVYWGGVYFQPL